MKLWLLSSVLPLSLAWPAPYNQSSIDATGIHELSRRAAAPVFYPWPGKLEKGGCDEHLDTINEAYDQALEMATQARNALDMLKSSRPKGGDAASKEEYNKALKWDKYQTSVRDLFNINIDSQKEPDADAKNQIQKLQDKFSRISQLKGSTGEPKDRKKPRLFCGEQGIPSMPAGETIAEEESEKAKERPAGRYGAWVYPQRKSKSVNKRIPLSKFDKGDYEKDVDHPCKAGGKAFALTKNDANAIFICDRGMEFQAKLIAPEEGKSMAKTLMKNRALSDTLLHEMFHLFWNLDDVRKVKFAHKGSDEPEWKDEAQRIPERDDDLVYGYLASYQLAKYVPKAASKTVETYVWFAISVFNEDWKFEGKDGEAKKIAWKK